MAHSTCPLIGINADFVPATKLQTAYARLNAGYFDGVVAAGGLPVILPPLARENEMEALLDRLDGVILSGGLDLDPRRLGQMPHRAVQPMPERRDENDRLLVRRILDRRLPVLGIAVGMHQLNVALGGSLYLHLPEDLPRSFPHFDPAGGPHRHLVLLEPNTRLDEIYGGTEIRVNSAHHQAIRQVGEEKFRLWALYLAACVFVLGDGSARIYQTVATRHKAKGLTGMPCTREHLYRPHVASESGQERRAA